MGDDIVVSAGETGDGVEEDHYIHAVLHESLRPLDHHVGHLDMALLRLVEGGGDHLAADGALHFSHLLGAFVDEQDDELDGGLVGGDGVGELLEEHGLSGERRGDDEAALTVPNGTEEVHDPHAHLVRGGLQVELPVRMNRGEVFKENPLLCHLRGLVVDGLYLEEREVSLGILGGADLPIYGVAGLEVETLDLGMGHVDVIRPRHVVVRRRPEKPITVLEYLQDSFRENEAVLRGLRLEDLEDDVGLLEAGDAFDAEIFRNGCEFGDCLFL